MAPDASRPCAKAAFPVAPRVTGARLEIVAALVYLAAMMRTYILALAIGLAGAGAAIAEPPD
jgi:hypothetical protein